MTKITKKEWLLLSRYLDGDLSAEQLKQIEEQLKSNAELKKALESLAHTRLVLRRVPRYPVPHSFTLREEMVRKKGMRRIPLMILRYSSAAATIVAIIAFALQFFLPYPARVSTAAEAKQSEMRALDESIPQEGMEVTKEPQIILWNPGEKGSAGGVGGAENYPHTLALLPTATPQAASYGIESAAPEEMFPLEQKSPLEMEEPASTAEAGGGVQPEENVVSEDQKAEKSKQDLSNLILGIAPVERRGSIQAEETAPRLTEEEPEKISIPFSFLGIALVAAVVAVVCAVLAFILHRKQA